MLKARISSRGQLALPKEVRDQLGLGEGTSVTVRVDGDEVILRKVVPGNWRECEGRFRGSNLLWSGALEEVRNGASELEVQPGGKLEHARPGLRVVGRNGGCRHSKVGLRNVTHGQTKVRVVEEVKG